MELREVMQLPIRVQARETGRWSCWGCLQRHQARLMPRRQCRAFACSSYPVRRGMAALRARRYSGQAALAESRAAGPGQARGATTLTNWAQTALTFRSGAGPRPRVREPNWRGHREASAASCMRHLCSRRSGLCIGRWTPVQHGRLAGMRRWLESLSRCNALCRWTLRRPTGEHPDSGSRTQNAPEAVRGA